MAKKSIATFRGKGQAALTKIILPVKNKKTGSYSFKEEMVPTDQVKQFLAKHK